MKKVIAFLVMIVIVVMSTLSTTAMNQLDSYAQEMIQRGYTEEDVKELKAIHFLSEENVKPFILQKYDELKDWQKVRAYYKISEDKYENYMIGEKMRQEVLDSIPDYIFDEMKARGWTQSEISNFVNRTNISKINCEYAWQECKKGRTIEDIVEEKNAVDKQQSDLDTVFVSKNMSVQEYETRLAEILDHDVVRKTDNMIADAVAQVVELRNKTHQRHKESSGITEEEIKYCQSQGMTNPMDMYQAKSISKGNNVPFEQVVQTYLKVGYWSVAVVEILGITPEEYIKSLEDSVENNPSGVGGGSVTKEMIQQIRDFYSLNNEGLKQEDNQDVVQEVFNIDDYIVLMVGSSKSYVCGTQKQIDEKNPDVSIFVENDRSYVPIRFLTENYGGSVEWIEETQTVNLLFDDSRISLTIGETEIHVDDEVIISDVAPVLKNGRTFLPLRACVNALDKHVFYSNGLILISEFQSDLDEIEDCKLIDEIIEKYYK